MTANRAVQGARQCSRLQRWKRRLRGTSLVLLDGLLSRCWVPRHERRVCLTVRLDHIGDLVLFLDAARDLRAHYAGWHMVLACHSSAASLAAALPVWDEVIAVDGERLETNLRYRWAMLRQVRRLGAEVAIQPVLSRAIMTGDSLMRASGAPQRIGSSGDLSNITRRERAWSDRWYSRLVPAAEGSRMEYLWNQDFLRALGIPAATRGDTATGALRRLAGAQERRVQGDYQVLIIGGSWPEKKWPVAAFAGLANELWQRLGWRIVLSGAADSREDARSLAAGLPAGAVVDLAGTTSLPELIGVIAASRLVVGNDTAGIHLAAVTGIPAVAILGGGHFGRFLPYAPGMPGIAPQVVHVGWDCFGCSWRCVRGARRNHAFPCIDAVTPGAVADACLAAVGRGQGQRA